MAIREEADFMSENERKFLLDSFLHKPALRAEGRELMQQRKIRVQFRRSDVQSQAEVQLGRTRVLANVQGELVPPFPDRPTEGFLKFSVELSSMASQNFEVGRPSPLAVELARIVERAIRESRALDTEALVVVAGERVWSITCTIHVVDHGGNLVDAVSLAAIAALMHYRRPEVSVQGADAATLYHVDDSAVVPLSLHHLPISISFCFIERPDAASNDNDDDVDHEPIVFMDPTDREERVIDGSITFTFNSFRELCAVHKMGGAAISTTQVLKCASIAVARVAELTDFLREEAEKADQEATERRRALLRGRTFQDKSSLSFQEARQDQSEVDLGEMTDYKMLHAPIALRDGPTKEEDDARVSSMAHLLESLEVAANREEVSQQVVQHSASTNGLELSATARQEFQQLTSKLNAEQTIVESSDAMDTANKKMVSAHDDSDSEEEVATVVQSEFKSVELPPAAPSATVSKPASTRKPPLPSADDDDDDSDEEMDLSAAIKRKPRH